MRAGIQKLLGKVCRKKAPQPSEDDVIHQVSVVTGEPRSGTSMMIQTAMLLGAPIWGEAHPQEKRMAKTLKRIPWWRFFRRAQKRMAAEKDLKHAKNMNPHGFYEVPGVVASGFRKLPKEHAGKVVKIITSGIYERSTRGNRIGTPSKYLKKIILCLRDPRNIAISQTDLVGTTKVAEKDENDELQWANAGQPMSPLSYVRGMGSFVIWLTENEHLDSRIMVVDYNDMHEDRPVEKVAKHLGLDPTEEQLKAARDNIDPKLFRAKDFKGWGTDDIEGELAEDIYNALKSWDRSKFMGLRARIEEVRTNLGLESVQWVDSDSEWASWVLVTAAVMRRGRIDRLNPKLIPFGPQGCEFFSKSEEKYTIERPRDFGPLERHMVKCNRDGQNVTIEYCRNCFQRGSIRDGKSLAAQRKRNGER